MSAVHAMTSMIMRIVNSLATVRGLWLCNIVLMILLVFFITKLTMLLVTEPAKPEIQFAGNRLMATSEFHLYPAPDLALSNRSILPEARIRAKVLGLVSIGTQSYATVAVEGKKEAVFRVGDDLSGSVKIESIDNKGIIVREQGVLRRIFINRLEMSESMITGETTETPFVAMERETPLVASERDLLNEVGYSVEMTDDGAGLRISSVPVELADILGIQEDDLITEFNGVPVLSLTGMDNPGQVLLEKIPKASSLTIRLLRNGEQTDIDVDKNRLEELLKP